MNNVFLVFEPLNHMFKVIIAAKKRGLNIVVLHSMPLNCPPSFAEAANCIDGAIEVKDWLDNEAIISAVDDVARDMKIVGTYAAAELTLYAEALTRKKYGLPVTPPEVIKNYLDKYNVRKKLHESGLTELKFIHGDEISKSDVWQFSGAAFFKPCCGAGSTRVKKCLSIADVREQEKLWLNKDEIFPPVLRTFIEHNNDYFVESAAEGELVSVECLVFNGEPNALGLSSRSLLRRNPTIELGASFPYQHKYSAAIIEKVVNAHKVLGITHGPTHTEVMVSEDGKIEIIEVNLRMAGSDMLLVMSSGLKINFEELLVDLSIGKKPETDFSREQHISAMQLVLAPSGTSVFESIEFPAEVEYFRQLKQAGATMKSTDTEGDYIGSFIISAKNSEQLKEKVSAIRKNIRVNNSLIADTDNNDVILA